MPIDYKKYPVNWKTEIRPSILKRAENRCEFCKIPNYAVGHRSEDGSFCPVRGSRLAMGASCYKEAKDYLEWLNEFPDFPIKYFIIVLTIAHLDQNIKNNKPENLRALCQRCHLKHDAKHKARNRKTKKNQLSIF